MVKTQILLPSTMDVLLVSFPTYMSLGVYLIAGSMQIPFSCVYTTHSFISDWVLLRRYETTYGENVFSTKSQTMNT